MLIVGAKGFAKELLEVMIQCDATIKISFFDNVSENVEDVLYGKYKVIKFEKDLPEVFQADKEFGLGVGGTVIRKKMTDLMIKNGGKLRTVISPFSHIGHFNNFIGIGCTIMTGAVITNDIQIGEGTLINLNSTVGHDSKIGAFCDISPGVHVSGNCTIGNFCALGTGCVILSHVKLADNVTVGAGAVVNKDVAEGLTVVGVPAKILK